MDSELANQEEFLLNEYKTAVQLTFHIDELRNKLTSFYLTFTGIAVAALAILLKGEAKEIIFKKPQLIIFLLIMIIGIIGLFIIAILARLRKVQIEHFHIINNIRTYFLKLNYEMWNTIQLSEKTLPKPNMLSGTYFWLLIIVLVSSSLLTLNVYFFLVLIFKIKSTSGFWVSIPVFFITIYYENKLYFKMSSASPQIEYSNKNRPF